MMPHVTHHRIAACLRFLLKLKGRIVAARGELGRWAAFPTDMSINV